MFWFIALFVAINQHTRSYPSFRCLPSRHSYCPLEAYDQHHLQLELQVSKFIGRTFCSSELHE